MVKARQIDCHWVVRGRFAVCIAVLLPKEPEQLQGRESPNSLEWAHLYYTERKATWKANG